jgi:transcriptional regulator with XRE-family HTH domain
MLHLLNMDDTAPLPRHVQRWRLREWRRSRRLSQEALADQMGATKAQISKLELYQVHGPGKNRQKMNDSWLERYCTALGISPLELSELPGTQRPIDEILKAASPTDQKRFRALAEAFIKSDH